MPASKDDHSQGLSLVSLVEISKALGDEARLRILALISNAEMSVKDICDILGQSQPRVSRHIKILADAGLIKRTKEGAWLYCKLNRFGAIGHFITSFLDNIDDDDDVFASDLRRFETIVSQRIADADRFFDENAQEWDRIRELQIPDTLLDQEIKDHIGKEQIENLLDVGTGTGQMLEILHGRYQKATGIDMSSAMLRVARGRLAKLQTSNVSFQQVDILSAGQGLGQFDCVICHHVLHFIPNAQEAIARMAECVKTNGRLIIIDYLPHSIDFLAQDYHHMWNGFPPEEMARWFSQNSLSLQHMQSYQADLKGKKKASDSLVVGLWVAQKSA